MSAVFVRTLSAVVAVAALVTAAPRATADVGATHTRVVPCRDNAALITAITRVDAAGSGTVRLARNCVYTLSQSFPGDYGNNALPRISGDITIEGNGATLARARTAPNMRIVEVTGHGALTLKDLTLTNGRLDPAFSFGGDAYVFLSNASLTLVRSRLTRGFARWGGGVLNDGPLVVDHSSISHNSTSYGGGGIWSHGPLLVDASDITANTGTVEIGGIATGGLNPEPKQTVIVRASRVSGNQGTGIATDVNTTTNVIDSLVAGNTGTAPVPGGGIDNAGTTTLTGSRVYDNHSPSTGGGICNGKSACDSGGRPGAATLRLVRTSVSGNTAATYGGGIFNDKPSTVTLIHSTVHGNRPDDCFPPGTCPCSTP